MALSPAGQIHSEGRTRTSASHHWLGFLNVQYKHMLSCSAFMGFSWILIGNVQVQLQWGSHQCWPFQEDLGVTEDSYRSPCFVWPTSGLWEAYSQPFSSQQCTQWPLWVQPFVRILSGILESYILMCGCMCIWLGRERDFKYFFYVSGIQSDISCSIVFPPIPLELQSKMKVPF